jgi:hypothetical protein
MPHAVRTKRVRRVCGGVLLVLRSDPRVTLVSVDKSTLAEESAIFADRFA